MSETKKCKICGEEKELSKFQSARHTTVAGEEKIYYRSRCLACRRIQEFKQKNSKEGKKTSEKYQKQYKATGRRNKVDKLRRERIYKEGPDSENFKKMYLKWILDRARQKGLAFEITWEDIVVPETCPVLGIEIRLGGGRQCYSSPSIDRLDNNLGYTKENIRFISWRANTLKNDASFEEIELLYNWMKKELGKE